MFELDLVTGILQVGFLKISIEHLITYSGLIVGGVMHYWKLSKLADAKAKEAGLKEEEVAAYKKELRSSFIKNNADTYFNRAEKLAEETEGEFDDKAVFYLKKFSAAFKMVFDDLPTEDELKQMEDRAHALAHQDHLAKRVGQAVPAKKAVSKKK